MLFLVDIIDKENCYNQNLNTPPPKKKKKKNKKSKNLSKQTI